MKRLTKVQRAEEAEALDRYVFDACFNAWHCKLGADAVKRVEADFRELRAANPGLPLDDIAYTMQEGKMRLRVATEEELWRRQQGPTPQRNGLPDLRKVSR